MSWTERECVECGTYVSFGIYYSEHEHEDTEIDITVKCGYCVNGTTEEEEEEKKQKFQEELINTVNIDDFSGILKQTLEHCKKMYNESFEPDRSWYLQSFCKLLKSKS